MKKRFLSLVLLTAIIAAQVVSCADNSDKDSQDTNDEQTETTSSTIASYLPDMDLSDFTLRVATYDYGKNYFYAEEATADVVNDAIYDSINLVKNKYGAKIEPVIYGSSSGDVRAFVTDSIAAEDNAFDIVSGHDGIMFSLALEGNYLDVRELQYQDFSQPWYPEYANDAYMINGKQYVFSSYMSTNSLAWASAIYMNKTVMDNYKLELPYDSVRNGTWTLDKFLSLSKSVYEDLDSDGTHNANDLYGFVGYSKLYGWQAAFVTCYNEDKNGKISIDYNKEKFVDVITRMNELINGGDTGFNSGNEPDNSYFINGKSMLFYAKLEAMSSSAMRESDIDYGIVPVPKYDEAQENYITPSFDSQFAIPVTVQEPEKVSLLIEAYSSAGYNIIRPVYFDTALSAKYARDEDTVEMLQIIGDTLYVDLAYLNTSWGINGLGRSYMYILSNPNEGIASYIDSILPSEEENVKKLNDFFK